MNSRANICLLTAVLLCGCVHHRSVERALPPGAALIKTDRAFATTACVQGVPNAFRDFAAPEALLLPMGEAPVRGREAIYQAMRQMPPGDLTWTPLAAEISRCGDLGYTWGTYEFTAAAAGGKAVTSHGKYVTIWKRQTDGSWKFVLDIGNASPPPQ